MTILAIATWHTRPDLLIEQIESYDVAFDAEVVHMIHVNAEFRDRFFNDAHQQGINFSKYKKLFFAENPKRTRQFVTTHGYIHGVIEALRRNIEFDYVLFHTSSDLMIKKGAVKYIRDHDIGLARATSWEIENISSADNFSVKITAPNTWISRIVTDPKAYQLVKNLGQKRIFSKRVEGVFFRKEIFFEMMFPILSYFNIEDIENQEIIYPAEEFLFAQGIEFISSRQNLKRGRHIIKTIENGSVDDIDAAYKEPAIFGIKRLPDKIDAPERTRSKELLHST